jgi:transposase
MGLSRRMFTKEFKLAAVQRLERGSSIGEVARALEVNPNVLHRWRREIRQGPGNVFPGHGKQRWADGRIADLERKIVYPLVNSLLATTLRNLRGFAR